MTLKSKTHSRKSLVEYPLPKPRLATNSVSRTLFSSQHCTENTLTEEDGTLEEQESGENGKENSKSTPPLAYTHSQQLYHSQLSSYDFMCQALQRKFENTRLNGVDDEVEEDAEGEEGEEGSRHVSAAQARRDSSWMDDSWSDTGTI